MSENSDKTSNAGTGTDAEKSLFTEKKSHKQSAPAAPICEMCVYYDFDELTEQQSCQAGLDEDETAHFLLSQQKTCRYFRFHDEYKTVQRQN